MATGLQCFDANGNLTLDITDRVMRFIGAYDVGVFPDGAGSFVDPKIGEAGGTPFAMFFVTKSVLGETCSPTVSVSGNTVSWVYPNNGEELGAFYRAGGNIFYGVS